MKTIIAIFLLTSTALASDPALIGRQLALAQKAQAHRKFKSYWPDPKEEEAAWQAYLAALKEP
jgi:hypothetical protein